MMKKQQGFTLVEVLIAMTILAILTAIAFPAYLENVRKGKRMEGQSMLLEAASKQQRFFSDNLAYAPDMGTLGYGLAGNNAVLTETGAYSVSVSAIAADNSSYTLTATGLNDQANDGCGNLSLTSTGVKGETGTLTVQDCWR